MTDDISRLGYGVEFYDSPTSDRPVVEVTADEFDAFFLTHYPQYLAEDIPPRPASDEPLRFIYADQNMKEWECTTAARLGCVMFKDSKPCRWVIDKKIYDEKRSKSSLTADSSAPPVTEKTAEPQHEFHRIENDVATNETMQKFLFFLQGFSKLVGCDYSLLMSLCMEVILHIHLNFSPPECDDDRLRAWMEIYVKTAREKFKKRAH